jgi:tetratricopeptide (TPR) repeat protein
MKRWLVVIATLIVLVGLCVAAAPARMLADPQPAMAQPAIAQDDAKKAEADAYKAWFDSRSDIPKAMELAKAYLQKFPTGQYADYLKKWIPSQRGIMFNQAMNAKDVNKMLQLGNESLAEDPNNLDYLYLLAYAIRQDELAATNYSHAAEEADYSSRAIKLIEDGKVPGVVPKDKFNKNQTLSYLYQTLALIDAKKKNTNKALEYYSKAASLDPTDPSNYLACGSMHQMKYQAAAAKYQAIPEADRTAADPKPEVKAALDDVNKEADSVIECWARFMAVSANNAAYGPTRTQVSSALTDLYKYRHPDSPDGLQKLIDQYKAQAGAPSAGNTASASTSHI